jgi:hypothetical protein
MESKEVKEKGKNKQTSSKKQNRETNKKTFRHINRER